MLFYLMMMVLQLALLLGLCFLQYYQLFLQFSSRVMLRLTKYNLLFYFAAKVGDFCYDGVKHVLQLRYNL